MTSDEEERRRRRNYVSNLYPNLTWQERVASMSTDRITAIYLRAMRDGQKPKPGLPPEEPKKDDDDDDDQLELF